MKLDCIGHVQKRAGTALREFRKKNAGKLKDGLPVGGRKHRLTDSCIDKLQKYNGMPYVEMLFLVTSVPNKQNGT